MQPTEGRVRPNHAKHKLAAGEPVICAIGLDSFDLVEQFGAADLADVVWIDLEHGPWNWAELANFSRACDLWGVTSQARVQRNEAQEILRVLEQGIQSVIVPHVRDRSEAIRAIDATFFTPKGTRGAGLSRQSYGATGYFEQANDEVMLGLMIEDIKAIENLEEIIALDDIDYFFIAPGDLSHSMGPEYAGKQHDPDVRGVINDAIQAIVAAGRTAGTVVSDETVNDYLDLGVRFLLYSPLPYLFSGAQRFRTAVEAYRGQQPELN
jgi:4-hydroxy-2-oxoheptanedioate aldolase